MNSRPFRAARLLVWPVGLLFCCLLSARAFAGVETATEKKRAQFAAVHRIVVAPPFYGTGRLAKTESGAASTPKLAEYLDRLRKLQDRTRSLLPERLSARTPYQIVPMSETEAALKAMELTPEKLYQNEGRMKGTRFAAPDPGQARKLAAQLHADAVVFPTLDEPRRSPDRLYFDPLGGLGVSEAHVGAKIGFWVLLADGTEAFSASAMSFTRSPGSAAANTCSPIGRRLTTWLSRTFWTS